MKHFLPALPAWVVVIAVLDKGIVKDSGFDAARDELPAYPDLRTIFAE